MTSSKVLYEDGNFYSDTNLPPVPMTAQNRQVYIGIPGRFTPEWVAGLNRNDRQVWGVIPKRHPNAVEMATDRVSGMIENLKAAIAQIDREVVELWVKDLVLAKAFSGLRFQSAILRALADRLNKPFRTATPLEESQGIDGYVGDQPLSIKPETYRSKPNLSEKIDVPIVYYEKKKDGIAVTADFL
jgi:hypothetical protein